jgi:hypothetical protein
VGKGLSTEDIQKSRKLANLSNTGEIRFKRMLQMQVLQS